MIYDGNLVVGKPSWISLMASLHDLIISSSCHRVDGAVEEGMRFATGCPNQSMLMPPATRQRNGVRGNMNKDED